MLQIVIDGLIQVQMHHRLAAARGSASWLYLVLTPGGRRRETEAWLRLYVPKTSSTSCDQAIFIDQASDGDVFRMR
jgi:hypothetical protein